jgi:hypothetical protein
MWLILLGDRQRSSSENSLLSKSGAPASGIAENPRPGRAPNPLASRGQGGSEGYEWASTFGVMIEGSSKADALPLTRGLMGINWGAEGKIILSQYRRSTQVASRLRITAASRQHPYSRCQSDRPQDRPYDQEG